MISHRRLLYSAGLLATLLLGCLPAIAQTASAQTSKPATISGRVVNESGRPLPNAYVVLRCLGTMDAEGINTITDREGKFEVSGLQPVSYQIFAARQGYTLLLPDLADAPAASYRAGDSVTLVL
ncbi:MAG TPA: carboxypeptidase-like regulatory domain-containing protein, partial [Anaerolineales bacterium]|nr:carboxypeptidase-like regulatory domain-containing protein [Anaerolineales bacterium]